MTYETNQPSPDQEPDPQAQRIVSEIEETRYEMGATINEIGNRLQPESIADQARERIREATVGKVERMVDDAGQTASRTGTTFIDTVRENPVPAALAAMGIGWLVVRMRDSASSGSKSYARAYDSRYATRYSDRAGSGYGAYASGGNGGSGTDAMERVRGVADQATGTAQDMADQAARRAQQVGSDVQQTAQQVAQNAVGAAQDTVQQAQWQFDRTLNQNPLALGALALGVGAAVGLALPETPKERELYAEPRQQLVGKVAEVANQALDQAQSKAQELGEQAQSNA